MDRVQFIDRVVERRVDVPRVVEKVCEVERIVENIVRRGGSVSWPNLFSTTLHIQMHMLFYPIVRFMTVEVV